MKRDDSLWKAILEDIFDDFLRFFFPNADELFDLNRGFEFLDKELEQLFPTNQDEFSPKYVDKLVKVFLNNGKEQWILVHIEVQGATDRHFGLRMFQYFYRILDKYQKPITAFAILTDRNKQFKPTHYEQQFLGTNLRYEFNSYKILDQDDAVLLEAHNPFAMVILTVKTALKKRKLSEEQLFKLKIDLAKRLLLKQLSKEKIRALMNFLKLYVRFGNEEFIGKFDQTVDTITNQSKTMGIEEFVLARAERIGELKGIKKGTQMVSLEKDHAFVKSLLEKTNFDTLQIADIASVTPEFVESVRKTIALS